MEEQAPKKPYKPKTKKPDLNTRIGKYYLARKAGKNKSQAQLAAGFPDVVHASRIENTKTYQAIEKHFKDELLQKITLGEISNALVDNIRQEGQDHIDRPSRNKAIEIALDKIEPNDDHGDSNDDRVIVVLRQ